MIFIDIKLTQKVLNMHKNISSIVALLLLSQLSGQASVQSDKAFRELDCQFKDCTKPKVIEKEKIVYVDKPVIQEKIVYVDKPVVEEKIVVQERIVEKIVYKDKEVEKVTPVKKQALANVEYNRANIDCTINGHSVVNDFIEYDSAGFDYTKFKQKLMNSGNAEVFCSVFGYLEIETDKQTLNLHVTGPRNGVRTAVINDLYYHNGKNLNTKIVTKHGIKYIKYQLKIGNYSGYNNGGDGALHSSNIAAFFTDATTLPPISSVDYAQKRGEQDVSTPIDTTKIFLFKE